MAVERTHVWARRTKRTSAVALGLVALLAGIAVAFFLTSTKFAGNSAVGGQLTVDSTLPLTFNDEPLYPTNTYGKTSTQDYAEQEFTVTNNNTVKVNYQLFATCAECIADPTDSPDQAAARQQKTDQYNHLWVTITQTNDDPATGNALDSSNKGPFTRYDGKLADLNPTAKAYLADIRAGDTNTYRVRLWLVNDPNNAQPQQVQNNWEFFIDARTPVISPTTTTLIPTIP